MEISASIILRFEQKFVPEPNSGCWLWIAASDDLGRGYFRVGSKTIRAHRVSYQLYIGPITDGLLVCHRCDTPSCVNPEHFFLGTEADNMADMGRKKRSKFHKTKFRGEDHGMAKLSEDDVREIRSRHKKGNGVVLAKEFGVWPGIISSIVLRRIWRHVL